MVARGLTCRDCIVRGGAICGQLAETDLARLKAISHFRQVRVGELIVDENCRPDYCAVLLRGSIKLVKGFADGRQQIVGLLLPSDFLGRLYGTATYRAEAGTDVELCAFPTTQLETLLKEHPMLEHRFLQHTLNELDAARDWIAVLGRKTAPERIASFLLLLVRRAVSNGPGPSARGRSDEYDLPLRHREIADHLGLRTETVSRQMSLLKARGIISLGDGARSFAVLDFARLQASSEQSNEH